jgi:hypothetical protein
MLDLAVQRYPDRRGEDILVFFHDLIHLFLLCGEIDHRGPGCGCNISLTLRANHKEDKFLDLRDDLPTLLGRDQENSTRRDCLRYPAQFLVQSNNNTMKPRLIYNMIVP